MKRLLDMTIAQRLTLGFGLALLLMAAGLVHLLVGQSTIDAMRARQAELIEPRASAAERLESAILYKALALRTLGVTKDPQQIRANERATETARELFAALDALPKDLDGQQIFAPVPEGFARYVRDSEAFVRMVQGGSPPEALHVAELALAAQREEFLEPLRRFTALQARKLADSRKAIIATQRDIRRGQLMMASSILGLLVGVSFFTIRAVRKPALELLAASGRIATGDYAQAMRSVQPLAEARGETPRDELRRLARGFMEMARRLAAREERIAAGARLSSLLAAHLDLSRLGEAVIEPLTRQVGAHFGLLYLNDRGSLRRVAAFGLHDAPESFSEDEGIPGQALRSRRALVVRDIPEDAPFQVRLGFAALPPRQVAAVPVLFDAERLGVLIVGGLGELDGDAIAFLEQAATQLGVSVRNGLSHRQVRALAEELREANSVLQAQNEELQAQGEEIQAQNEELQAQNEELHTQSDEVRKQSEQLARTLDALCQSEERLRRAIVNAPFPIMIHAEDGRVLQLSRAWTELTGYTTRELPTVQAWAEKACGVDPADLCEKVARLFDLDEPSSEGEQVVRTRDGSTRIWDFASSPLGRIEGQRVVVSMAVDVTDRKRAEEQLREADLRKNEFLAVLSHELRNPLAPIRNSLYVLDRTAPGSEQARRAQTVINRQVNHLTRLVDDLLDVTRISRGKIQLQRGPVELGRLVRQCAEDCRPMLENGGLRFHVEMPAEELWTDGDGARLGQVVGNLLMNAAKFTPRGREVSLSLERDEAKAVLRVRDTGLGMDRAILARLFQPFTQADATLSRSRGGLGLGLALVKGLVELHGGTVAATSDGPESGSEFTVYLPLKGPPAVRASGTRPHIAALRGESHGLRVLIVEDNPDAAASLREALELAGHQVSVAHDGGEGLASARAQPPDVIVCDIGLPGMDGYEVARAVRSDPALREVFLVALTGYALPADRQRALDAGFQEHLAKPPDLGRLEELLALVPGEATGSREQEAS